MQTPSVQSWDFHAPGVCENVVRMMDRNKQKDPLLLVLPGLSNTLIVLLANGPEVGLPFIVSFGIPKRQQSRFQEYFLFIWKKYARSPANFPSEGLVRQAQYVASPGRDKLGLVVWQHPSPDKLLATCRVLRLLRDRWPVASVTQMGVTIPPVGLGDVLPV